jgi:NADPH-dependent glutamate synthase beta subunit-like oxidoreductase
MEPGFDLPRALAEAQRCLLCHDPPCSRDCPADTDPGLFIRKLRLRNITGAIRVVKENNILGGACGVLCPTHRLCEAACSACGIDRPIAIGKIQRFLVEHSWRLGFQVFERPQPRKERVAVVGAGPAGLSCAGELARQGFQVTVFESRPEPGGIIRYGVPSFRFDREFLAHELADIEHLGVTFQCNQRITGREGVQGLLDRGFQAVFLAPGLDRPLALPGVDHDIEGVWTWRDFLAALREERFEEFEPLVRDRTVAVIGGGSVAMDSARSALRLGARDVYLLYRRSYLQMPAEEDEKREAQEEGVHFLLLNQPVRYIADDQGRLAAVELRRTTLGEPDASGRRSPVEIPGSEWRLEATLVIEALGAAPDPETSAWAASGPDQSAGLIPVDPETCATHTPGIFAGGDIIRGSDLVVTAVRDGKRAARAITRYLLQEGGR